MKIKLYTIFYILLLSIKEYYTEENSDVTNKKNLDTNTTETNSEEEEDYASPCEETQEASSYDDCKQKSTEFIYEVCCFLKGQQHGNPKLECIDVTRDDIRKEKDLNLTRDKIKNGTYWSSYNDTYDSIESIICFSNYYFLKIYLFFIFLIIII